MPRDAVKPNNIPKCYRFDQVVFVKTAEFIGDTIKVINDAAVRITADINIGGNPGLSVGLVAYWKNADFAPIVAAEINLLRNK